MFTELIKLARYPSNCLAKLMLNELIFISNVCTEAHIPSLKTFLLGTELSINKIFDL